MNEEQEEIKENFWYEFWIKCNSLVCVLMSVESILFVKLYICGDADALNSCVYWDHDDAFQNPIIMYKNTDNFERSFFDYYFIIRLKMFRRVENWSRLFSSQIQGKNCVKVSYRYRFSFGLY